jgi:SagB-type dehydrogenase family enzyme
MFLRRSPHLVTYWRQHQLIIENYRTRTSVAANAAAVEMLDACSDWISSADLTRQLASYSPAKIATAIRGLQRLTLLEVRSRRPRRETASDPWASWHPAAGLLHFSTKDARYRDAASTAAVVRARARVEPMPSVEKRRGNGRTIALPRPAAVKSEFPQVLLQRRTWRKFAESPLPLVDLSTLLWLSCGIHHWLQLQGLGRLALKTYPSGGAHHPLEMYVLARRVSGLKAGLYHYGAGRHDLELVRAGASGRDIARYIPNQPWFSRASALLLMTAVFPRVQWKYRFSRAYRVVLAEAGHLCQNVCLTATWLGLAPFCTMALADSAIERDLQIDGVSEGVVYVAGVGMRPHGIAWAPWPTKRRLIRTPNTF